MKNTYSQREFANLIGVSTATLSNMIKSGEIKKAPDGRIPQIEIQHYYENVIRKYANRGTLIITNQASDTDISSIKESFESACIEKEDKTPRYFNSVYEIISEANKFEDTGSSEVQMQLLQERYNLAVLSALIQQYQSKAADYFTSLVVNKKYPDFCKLPCEIAFDLILYGKIYVEGYFDSAVEDYLASVDSCMQDIQFAMDSRFDLLMRELKLVGKDDQLLFKRTQLTPDFFNKSGSLYNSFFYNKGKKDVVYIAMNEKIKKTVIGKSQGRKIKDNIENLLSDNFYTICNIDGSDEGASKIASVIGSGYYGNLLVMMDESSYSKVANSLLWVTTSIASGNNRMEVEYSN